jgi:hypothetical protein
VACNAEGYIYVGTPWFNKDLTQQFSQAHNLGF